MGVAGHLRDSVTYNGGTMVIEEITRFSSYQRHGKYYELSLCFLVLLQTLGCLWALLITFCGDYWKRFTGHHFVLAKFSLLSGAEALTDLSVATVKIVLTGVLQLQSIIKCLVVLSASGADCMLVPKRE